MLLLSAWISLNERRHWKNNSPFRVLTHSTPLFFSSIWHLHSYIQCVQVPILLGLISPPKQTKTKPVSCLGGWARSTHLIAEVFVCCGDLSDRPRHILELTPTFSVLQSRCLCWVFRAHKRSLILWVSMPLHTLIPISSSLLSQITWFLCLTSILKKLVISPIYCCRILCSLSVCMVMHLRFLIFFIGEFLRGAKIISHI